MKWPNQYRPFWKLQMLPTPYALLPTLGEGQALPWDCFDLRKIKSGILKGASVAQSGRPWLWKPAKLWFFSSLRLLQSQSGVQWMHPSWVHYLMNFDKQSVVSCCVWCLLLVVNLTASRINWNSSRWVNPTGIFSGVLFEVGSILNLNPGVAHVKGHGQGSFALCLTWPSPSSSQVLL